VRRATFGAGALTAVAGATDCKAQYDALKEGHSYARAMQIMRCGGEELSSSSVAGIETVMYMWDGNGFGANMNAMFQNDAMMAKAQFGLK
jgi:hypothetical protein